MDTNGNCSRLHYFPVSFALFRRTPALKVQKSVSKVQLFCFNQCFILIDFFLSSPKKNMKHFGQYPVLFVP
jgi:hypothetical protein